jgi:hypothetical protein
MTTALKCHPDFAGAGEESVFCTAPEEPSSYVQRIEVVEYVEPV